MNFPDFPRMAPRDRGAEASSGWTERAYTAWARYVDSPLLVVLVVILAAAVLAGPYAFLGQDVAVLEHDYLDQIDRLGPIKDGKLVESSWHPIRWVAHSLGLFSAHVVSEISYRIVAFVGMWLLVRHLTKDFAFPRGLIALIACAFAALPFWPQGRLSVAGIPLALYAAASLRHRRRVLLSCVLLAFHASWSSLALSGVFLIALLLAFVVYEGFHHRWHWWLLIGVGILGSVYALSSLTLFDIASSTLGGESSRSEFRPSAYKGEKLQDSVERAVRLLLYNHYHASSGHSLLILPSCIGCIAYLFARERWRCRKLIIAFVVYVALSSLSYASFYSVYFLPFYDSLGLGFNYTRWYFLVPAMWYAVWAVVIANTLCVADNRPRAALVSGLLLIAQAGLNLNEQLDRLTSGRPTFAQFTSPQLFAKVKSRIQLASNELIGCVGFHPAAARYNELNTVDFYRSAYILTEKHRIRRIIQPVMDRSPTIARYFNHWGARAYLFDDEIGTGLSDQRRFRVIPSIMVNYDKSALQDAGVKYLLSTIPFRNANEAGYELVHQDDNGYYRMFVYRVY